MKQINNEDTNFGLELKTNNHTVAQWYEIIHNHLDCLVKIKYLPLEKCCFFTHVEMIKHCLSQINRYDNHKLELLDKILSSSTTQEIKTTVNKFIDALENDPD